MAMEHTETHVQSLDMSTCSHDIWLPGANLPTTLRKLIVQNCEKLVIPMDQPSTTIDWISISESCDSLTSFPMCIFPNLSYIFLKGCKALVSLSLAEESLQYLTGLYSLSIINCSAFVSFPRGGISAPNLTHLSVSECESLISLPDNMDILLPSLQTLIVYKCPKLESFSGGSLPSGLMTLHIGNCDRLVANRLDWNLQGLTSLKMIGIIGRCENMETFPEDGLLPANVTELFIDGFDLLKTLNGKGLLHLTSLSNLSISMCPQIQSLPEEGLPSSVTFLSIWGCPSLNQRCQRDKGADWPKIAHIPHITIEGKSC